MAAARAQLLRDCRSQYLDPIALARGEQLRIGRRDDEWPQFYWATDARGRCGRVHQGYLDGPALVRARRDHSARELDAAAGDVVSLVEEAGGWWWCVDARGASGWLPARDLQIESEEMATP